MPYFTYGIQHTVEEKLPERAKYLLSLFSADVQNFSPAFYLDIGVGAGYNTLDFGENASEILAVDLVFTKDNVLRLCEKAHLLVADGSFLPFKKGLCEAVSLFSVVEHVSDQKLLLREALRVLKSEGKLIIQVPNRFFPVDLHSGLPSYFFIPRKIRKVILRKIGYGWLADYDIPCVGKLMKMIYRIEPKATITLEKVVYPSSLVWPKLRAFYRIVRKVGILRLVPLGYLLVIEK